MTTLNVQNLNHQMSPIICNSHKMIADHSNLLYSGVVKGGEGGGDPPPPNCVQDHSKSLLNPYRSWGGGGAEPLVQFINSLYGSVTSDVILTTFAWNFRGSANNMKQAAESCF